MPEGGAVKVRRALVSVSDKTGLAGFAAALSRKGVELVSTGGTARAIAESGTKVRDVAELTAFPEIMDGRVKTLHPSIHGALLGLRDDPGHAAQMRAHGIEPIDLLVVNLYPFERARASGAAFAALVENIDIGGPAMLRAAAKNHAYVAAVTDPSDYVAVIGALEINLGSLSLDFRQKLAAKAFARTAAYDAAISGWFAETLGIEHPVWASFGGRLDSVMRYGENPHQRAGLYLTGERRSATLTPPARSCSSYVLCLVAAGSPPVNPRRQTPSRERPWSTASSSSAVRGSTTSRTSTCRCRGTASSCSPGCPAPANPRSRSTRFMRKASGATSRACPPTPASFSR